MFQLILHQQLEVKPWKSFFKEKNEIEKGLKKLLELQVD